MKSLALFLCFALRSHLIRLRLLHQLVHLPLTDKFNRLLYRHKLALYSQLVVSYFLALFADYLLVEVSAIFLLPKLFDF